MATYAQQIPALTPTLMGAGTANSLLLLLLLLPPLLFSSLVLCMSGTLIGFPFDAKGDVGITLATADIESFSMGRHKISSTGIRVPVEDLGLLLGSSSTTCISFHLRFGLLDLKNLCVSKVSTFSFLKSKLTNLPPNVNIFVLVNSDVVVDPLLLPTLHSIHHALTSIRPHQMIKVIPILSLAFLENMCKNHVMYLQELIKFLRKHDSPLVVEIPADGELGCEDCFDQFFVQRPPYNTRTKVCDIDVPVVHKIQVSAVSKGGKLASTFSKVVEFLRLDSQLRSRIREIFVQIPFSVDSSSGKGGEEIEILPSSHRLLLDHKKEYINATITTIPITTSTPSVVVTVPSTNPVTVLPTNPMIPSVTVPSTLPSPLSPTTNPATTPTSSVQSWCVAKGGASNAVLQVALDYACGIGGVDCSPIQQEGPCYNPNTLVDHASYAFNSYYQKNPTPTSCDFGGTAMLVNVSPAICTKSATTPATVPATNPITPVTTPSTILPPPTLVPVTNPAVVPPPPPIINPVTDPLPPPHGIVGGITPGTIPVSPGNGAQIWCVAKTDVPDAALETAINYACGMGGADCSAIQQTGSCYIPNTLHDHASYAFNIYYQKNPTPASCDFGGIATLVSTNPSSGSCTYPVSSTSSPAFNTGTVPGGGGGSTVFGSSSPIVSNGSVSSGAMSSTTITSKPFSPPYVPVVLLSLVMF